MLGCWEAGVVVPWLRAQPAEQAQRACSTQAAGRLQQSTRPFVGQQQLLHDTHNAMLGAMSEVSMRLLAAATARVASREGVGSYCNWSRVRFSPRGKSQQLGKPASNSLPRGSEADTVFKV